MSHSKRQPHASDKPAPIPAAEHHAATVDNVRPDTAPTKWWLYLLELAGPNIKLGDIAARIGIDQSHLTRWKTGYAPGVPFVVKTAEAYGRPVVEALVAAEVITEEQAELRTVRVTDPSNMTTEELLEELRRRVEH